MSGKKDKTSINLIGNSSSSSASRKKKIKAKTKSRRQPKARVSAAIRKTARSRR
tara:strand:+ start:89 stop:250 length:162 start_codon:yes stop_codon:yes gene_type:complete